MSKCASTESLKLNFDGFNVLKLTLLLLKIISNE